MTIAMQTKTVCHAGDLKPTSGSDDERVGRQCRKQRECDDRGADSCPVQTPTACVNARGTPRRRQLGRHRKRRAQPDDDPVAQTPSESRAPPFAACTARRYRLAGGKRDADNRDRERRGDRNRHLLRPAASKRDEHEVGLSRARLIAAGEEAGHAAAKPRARADSRRTAQAPRASVSNNRRTSRRSRRRPRSAAQ